jgi:hypothetical protein
MSTWIKESEVASTTGLSRAQLKDRRGVEGTDWMRSQTYGDRAVLWSSERYGRLMIELQPPKPVQDDGQDLTITKVSYPNQRILGCRNGLDDTTLYVWLPQAHSASEFIPGMQVRARKSIDGARLIYLGSPSTFEGRPRRFPRRKGHW